MSKPVMRPSISYEQRKDFVLNSASKVWSRKLQGVRRVRTRNWFFWWKVWPETGLLSWLDLSSRIRLFMHLVVSIGS